MNPDSLGSKVYPAPWGKALRRSSLGLVMLSGLLPLGFACLSGGSARWIAAWLLPLLLAGTVPFMIRSYAIRGGDLFIRWLFWTTRVPLAGLKSAEVIPGAMSRSLRICGNGGAFSFAGWFWNKPLGHYRAFVTDLDRTVVLRFAKRTVVVSPTEPEDFVRQLVPTTP